MKFPSLKVWVSGIFVGLAAVAGVIAAGGTGSRQSQANAADPITSAEAYKVTMSGTEHPFLVTNRSKIATLRGNVDKEPYKTIRVQAAKDCNDIQYRTTGTVEDQDKAMTRIMGACALMYIIDPANNAAYVTKIEKGLTLWPGIRTQLDAQYGHINHWLLTVPTSTAFFNAVIAYDVIYNQIPASRRATYDANMVKIVEWYQAADRGFGTAQDAPPLMWHAFKRDKTKLPADLAKYHADFFKWVSPDTDAFMTDAAPGMGKVGSFIEGTEYGLARIGGERAGKADTMHILEFTGLDKRYYKDVRVKGLVEFLLGSAYGPNNVMVGFEDSGSGGRDFNTFKPQSMVYDAGRISADAAGYASYRRQVGLNPLPPSDLFTYVMAVVPAPVKYPSTQAYSQGGFFAWEEGNHSKDALMAALWNTPHQGKNLPHSNYNTNSLFMIYDGLPVMVNAGYGGAGISYGAFTPDYMKQYAYANNTVTLGGQNHWNRNGGQGLSEWTIGNGIDYASGQADYENGNIGLFHGNFERNMVFVQPQDGVLPYVIVMDQINKAIAGTKVDAYFHPAAKNIETHTANSQYLAPIYDIAGKKQTQTYLNFFFSKSGVSVVQKDGFTGAWGNSTTLKYLDASYKVGSDGKADAVTVLFPSDLTHKKPVMWPVKGDNYEGSAVRQANFTDYAVTSNGTTAARSNEFKFIGSAALVRRDDKSAKTVYFLARESSWFDGGSGVGFTSTSPVTMHMRGLNGEITSKAEAVVDFKYPNIKSIEIDGVKRTAKTVEGGLRITVPVGLHKVTLSN